MKKLGWASRGFCSFTPPLESEIMLGLNGDFLRSMEGAWMSKSFATAIVTVLFCGVVLGAQQPAATPAPPAAPQTESDEYTRYELLAPESASFKIYYEVTATAAGAKVFFNPIRKAARRATKPSTTP